MNPRGRTLVVENGSAPGLRAPERVPSFAEAVRVGLPGTPAFLKVVRLLGVGFLSSRPAEYGGGDYRKPSML